MQLFGIDEILTPEEVAQALRVDASSVQQAADAGEIKHYRVFGQYRFKKTDVEAFFEAHYYTVQTASTTSTPSPAPAPTPEEAPAQTRTPDSQVTTPTLASSQGAPEIVVTTTAPQPTPAEPAAIATPDSLLPLPGRGGVWAPTKKGIVFVPIVNGEIMGGEHAADYVGTTDATISGWQIRKSEPRLHGEKRALPGRSPVWVWKVEDLAAMRVIWQRDHLTGDLLYDPPASPASEPTPEPESAPEYIVGMAGAAAHLGIPQAELPYIMTKFGLKPTYGTSGYQFLRSDLDGVKSQLPRTVGASA